MTVRHRRLRKGDRISLVWGGQAIGTVHSRVGDTVFVAFDEPDTALSAYAEPQLVRVIEPSTVGAR